MNPEFTDAFKDSTLRESTLRPRISYLNKLTTDLDSKSPAIFISQPNKVIEFINKSSNAKSTLATRFFHVLEYVKAINAPQNIIDKYDKAAKIAKGAQVAQVMNQEQEIDPNDHLKLEDLQQKVVEVFNTFKQNIGSKPKFLKALKSDFKKAYKQLKQLQSIVLVGVYTLMPPLRNNWRSIYIVSSMRGTLANKDRNYLIVSTKINGRYKLVLNTYKNSKSGGQVILDIQNKDLIEILNWWLSALKSLMGSVSTPVLMYDIFDYGMDLVGTENAIVKQLIRVSERYFGVPLSINNYRHIHEQYIQTLPGYNKMTPAERQTLHARLLHREETARNYYAPT